MLSYAEALDRLLAATSRLPDMEVDLGRAAGLVLAEALAATLTQPPFAASAMDGYAVRWADLPGPWHIVGESAAGSRFTGTVGAGEAVRIFTGARLPDGADTVVVQEDVARDGDRVRLTGDGPSREGAHIRRAGLDFGAGETVLRAGDRLTPARIGLAAASGNAVLKVVRRPRVALLATGDELVPPGITPGDDQIVSSNGVMLAALLRNIADVRDLGLQPDDAGSISRAIAAAADADLLLTIGGASVGERDLVQQALRDAGADIDFWKVAIKPGKPMIAGVLGDTRVLGLPGNPVSAFVCAVLFALPMLRKMAGFTDPHHRIVEARLLSDLPANGPRRDHIRARFDGVGVAPAPVQDSAMLSVLASSNALIVREAGAAAANPGDTVPLLLLDS